MGTSKRTEGNFFEDFVVGKTIHHAVPRTVTEGDLALYIALTGDRPGRVALQATSDHDRGSRGDWTGPQRPAGAGRGCCPERAVA